MHVGIWSKKKPKPYIIQPPTVMSKGSDPALLGKIRMVVEAIFEMGEAKIYIQKDNGIDYNGSVPRQVGVSRKVDTKDREREVMQIAADRYMEPVSVPDSSQLVCMCSVCIL